MTYGVLLQYVRFLRVLDFLLDLEQRCKLSRHPLMVAAIAKQDSIGPDMVDSESPDAAASQDVSRASSVVPDGGPPAKRRRLGGTLEKSHIKIKEPKRPGNPVKDTYQLAWEKANPGPPGLGRSRGGPFEFMVRKQWLEEYRAESGKDVLMQHGSKVPWWFEVELGDDMLLPVEVEGHLLDELPSSDLDDLGKGGDDV